MSFCVCMCVCVHICVSDLDFLFLQILDSILSTIRCTCFPAYFLYLFSFLSAAHSICLSAALPIGFVLFCSSLLVPRFHFRVLPIFGGRSSCHKWYDLNHWEEGDPECELCGRLFQFRGLSPGNSNLSESLWKLRKSQDTF